MTITRQERYDRYCKTLGTRFRSLKAEVPTYEEWCDKMDKQKAYTLERLSARRCPTTFMGAAKVAGGLNFMGDGVTYRFGVVMQELEEEGLVVCIHRPDGEDLYYAEGAVLPDWEGPGA